MSDDQADVHIGVDTEQEAYPVLHIWEWKPDADTPEATNTRRYAIPQRLLDDLNAASAALDDAETAIMRYIGERHPDAEDIREWLSEE